MSYQLGLRQLRYFMTVAESLHFRKASELLYISQPALSKQIDKLESELGVILFERNSRNVKLTESGMYLKKELKSSLRNIEDILDHSKLVHSGKAGRIRLGYVGSAMRSVIPDVMINFRKNHPSVRFSLKEMDNESQLKSLLDQEIDVGFVRIDKVPGDLIVKPFIQDTFSVVLPKSHPLNQEDFNSLSQLQDEQFILFNEDYSPNYYQKIISIFDQAGFEPSVSHSTVHAFSIFKMVENGFGISIVPSSLQEGYHLDIKFIEMTQIPQRAVLSVVWNPKNSNPIKNEILQYIPINDKTL